MIKVLLTRTQTIVEGHANFAEHGKDVVCGAVSTLTCALINSLEKLTQEEIGYTVKSGYVNIQHHIKTPEGRLLRDSFVINIMELAEEYKKYISVEYT